MQNSTKKKLLSEKQKLEEQIARETEKQQLVLGRYLQIQMESGNINQASVIKDLDRILELQTERQLFDLPARNSSKKTTATKAVSSGKVSTTDKAALKTALSAKKTSEKKETAKKNTAKRATSKTTASKKSTTAKKTTPAKKISSVAKATKKTTASKKTAASKKAATDKKTSQKVAAKSTPAISPLPKTITDQAIFHSAIYLIAEELLKNQKSEVSLTTLNTKFKQIYKKKIEEIGRTLGIKIMLKNIVNRVEGLKVSTKKGQTTIELVKATSAKK